MTGSEESPSFRLAYVPGVTPTKWVRIWNERLPGVPLYLVPATAAEAAGVLRDGGADAGFVRLPVDRTVFSAIPLYTETTVVVVPKDHVITAVDEVTTEDLADETVLHPLDDTLGWEDGPPGEPAFQRPGTTGDAVELVAAGIGVLVLPKSIARLHHRKDLTFRPVTDAPESSVALAWRQDATTDMVEDFIGIVRGRTVNSTRGRTQPQDQQAGGKKDSGKKDGGKQDGGRPAKGGSQGGGKQPKGAQAQGKRPGKPTAGKPAGKGPRGGSGGPKGGKPAPRGKPRRRP